MFNCNNTAESDCLVTYMQGQAKMAAASLSGFKSGIREFSCALIHKVEMGFSDWEKLNSPFTLCLADGGAAERLLNTLQHGVLR